jgi:hypothetical protein
MCTEHAECRAQGEYVLVYRDEQRGWRLIAALSVPEFYALMNEGADILMELTPPIGLYDTLPCGAKKENMS